MVVDLCLPHFHTSVHCNKLCADGYDVTNLVSADPVLRRRGFKLEYFLRPPVQVTLTFGFQVELCRVDVELWPWGMDRGQTCKRLEISTSSDLPPSQKEGQGHKRVQHEEQMQMRLKDQNEEMRGKQHERDSQSSRSRPEQRGRVFNSRPEAESTDPGAEFKLVGRCELREETLVYFTRSTHGPRPPFLSPPPPRRADSRQEELWSRGPPSLGAVTQLRVAVPYGGSASALGLKALAVWGQPARCCPPEQVERIKRIHEASEGRVPRPVLFAPSAASQMKPPQRRAAESDVSIPEEFLDPITLEVMLLPMLLPSGVSVDDSTLKEHQKREATWGRPPNDPFTGVPFTSTSQPLPNPQLKSRIDHFLLQKGILSRDGMLGRQGERESPQASRLLASSVDEEKNSKCFNQSSLNRTAHHCHAGTKHTNRTAQTEELLHSSDHGNHTFNPQPLATDSKLELERRKKRDLSGISKNSTEAGTAEQQLLPETKRPRTDAVTEPSCSSHEQRLSASLDEALSSALQGRPTFTSNLTQRGRVTPDSEPPGASQCRQAAGAPSTPAGERTCSACSCSVSVYSKSASSVYRLTCGHLLCRSCLRRESQPLNSASNHISCPACQSPTPRNDVIRVHH